MDDDNLKKYNQQEIAYINEGFQNLNTRSDSLNIYSTISVIKFLDVSLSYINLVFRKTKFTFDDTKFADTFHHLIVEGAVILATSNETSIKDGKELFCAWIKNIKTAKKKYEQT